MKISLIAAMANNGVIGRDNKMPWHLPEELKYFRQVTLGKPIIMGRKTFESIGKPLPGRKNIILSRSVMPDGLSGVVWVNTLDQALEAANLDSKDEAMVIGGAAVYQLFFPLADRLYLTRVDATVEGDAFFNGFNDSEWNEISVKHNPAADKSSFSYSFYVYDRLCKKNKIK